MSCDTDDFVSLFTSFVACAELVFIDNSIFPTDFQCICALCVCLAELAHNRIFALLPVPLLLLPHNNINKLPKNSSKQSVCHRFCGRRSPYDICESNVLKQKIVQNSTHTKQQKIHVKNRKHKIEGDLFICQVSFQLFGQVINHLRN